MSDDVERAAWEWLDKRTAPDEPADVAFSADDMVDAFMAGNTHAHHDEARHFARTLLTASEIVEVLEPFVAARVHKNENGDADVLIGVKVCHIRRAAALLSKVKEQG